MSEETTLSPLEEVVHSTYNRLVRQAHEFIRSESDVRGTLTNLNFEKRSLLHNMRALNALAESKPELFEFEYYKKYGNQLENYIYSFERDIEGDDPIEKLLNWTACGKESFVFSQIYDLIGKDDARTFKILLRDVIAMIDPVKAQDL